VQSSEATHLGPHEHLLRLCKNQIYTFLPNGNSMEIRSVTLISEGPDERYLWVRTCTLEQSYLLPIWNLYGTEKEAHVALRAQTTSGQLDPRVFHDALGEGANWVVALSEWDAAIVFSVHVDEHLPVEYGPQNWVECDPQSRLKIRCDEHLKPSPAPSAVEVELTCAMWVNLHPRRFLLSTSE